MISIKGFSDKEIEDYANGNFGFDEESSGKEQGFVSGAIHIRSIAMAEIEKRNAMLKEIRLRLLYDIDEDGQPKSSMVDLLKMWEKLNLLIDKK